MARSPFRVGQPAARNYQEPAGPKPHNPAATNAHAVDRDITLMEAAQELEPADGEVGEATHEGEEDGERPTHAPNIPWPPADVGKAVGKTPWKGLK